MTLGLAQKYIENGGSICPHCGHNDIHGDSITVDSGSMSQTAHCPNCEASWRDIYTLTGVQDRETDEEFEPPAGLPHHFKVKIEEAQAELESIFGFWNDGMRIDAGPNGALADLSNILHNLLYHEEGK